MSSMRGDARAGRPRLALEVVGDQAEVRGVVVGDVRDVDPQPQVRDAVGRLRVELDRDATEIVLAAGRIPDPGDHVSDHPALANAHRAFQQLPGALRARVTSYLAVGADDVDLLLEDGIVAHLGRAERMDEKARALGALLEDLRGRAVDAIDVRAPSRPVVVPSSAKVEVMLQPGDSEVYLTLDGQVGHPLRAGDRVKVREGATPVLMVRSRRRNYFEVLRRKLRWGER